MQLNRSTRRRRGYAVAAGLVLIGVAAFFGLRGWAGGAAGPGHRPSSTVASSDKVVVDVVTPLAGGINRVCTQPGTVEPFHAAELYSKVSGFLTVQHVDIGDPVEPGQELAVIWAPEYERQVEQDAADVKRAEARKAQMKAAIATAEANVGAAVAAAAFARAEKKSKASYRSYREKQRDRISALVSRMAIDANLADEQEDQYQAAVGAELAAGESVTAAEQKEEAARARLKEAHADLAYAQAEVDLAKAKQAKSEVLQKYTVIRSPYRGVVTKRNFDVGDFVRSADAGGERVPILAVEETESMRVVVQVPEQDAPFVDFGDPAVVRLDALPGKVFQTEGDAKVQVSRLAKAENPHTRMMRTEVHLKNTDGRLRHGMFGRVTIMLQSGSQDALRIPSSALVGRSNGEKGEVRVVRDGKAYTIPIVYGADSGSEVEVVSGLEAADQVIVRASGPLVQGAPVSVTEAKPASGGR